jgi:hypothetical protein
MAWRSSEKTDGNVTRLLVLIGLLLTAGWTVPQSRGGPPQDQISLIDALRRRNVTVDITGTVSSHSGARSLGRPSGSAAAQ